MNWLRNFMMGRYGVDQLNLVLLFFSMGCTLTSTFIRWSPLYLALSILGAVVLLWSVFRMFSRNLSARSRENQLLLRVWGKIKAFFGRVKGWFAGKKRRFADRKTHCYFSCPKCHKTLRLPKGKGKIEICCPICGEKFIKKT